ncbi:G patch domain-containing protein 1-like [Dendronephthya gigantea]|uniref:G patch domain-containing protein 1-like n=1 Tax=Dendronephthya gigantea TaxID=151771 RepID=UPI0010693B7A|nr:G patch domain-containing protein 1-like [Dendronephthya gigantea]
MAAEEESFVNIGTAFDVPDEDAPKKKSLPVHEQYATDSDGRRRFHGAFTGGFSAGYFNTVGSKEGWTPSTFVSSRAKRLESSRQKPEDFMDDEDLGDFGIAPRNVETTKLFSREREAREKRNNVPSTSGISLDSVMKYALEDLVVPCRMSIGVRLLKKMGWKEGQGIGPRVRQIPKKKVYGCVFHPGTAVNTEEDNEQDIYAQGLLFAPKDTTTIKFTPKDNLHGIGYKGMLAPVPAEMSKPGFSGNLKIKGQAFGVGAFEDDDEDVYTQDSMSNYDIELHDNHKQSHSDLHGWTGPPGQAIKGGALSLFAKASKPKPANKVFAPPSIPKGYQPFSVKETYDKKLDEKNVTRHTSETRGTLLGEQPLLKTRKSVFDLMSKDDRERIASTKKTLQSNYPAGKIPPGTNLRAAGFQPFAKDPAKQARYESFLESRKTGKESNAPSDLRCSLTEWEREREKEEFSRSAMLYQPLKGDIAARFTRGRNIDDDLPDKNQSKSTVDENKSVEEKAAEMKMFGKLTRKTFEWHPAKLLCKRFNIPEPYPSSSGTGLVGEKKEKFTLAQLFETSQKDESVDTCLREVTNVPDNSTIVSGKQVTAENVNTEENTRLNPTSDVMDTFEQKPSEKPSMDLFKAIFASSSEDESSKSDDEEFGNEQKSHLPAETSKFSDNQVLVVTSQETKTYHEEKFKEIHNQDVGVHKYADRDSTQASIENAKNIPGQNITEQNTMEEEEEEEEEYGPRPPPIETQTPEESYHKSEYRKTVPFSRYDSNSESDSDRPKRKHKRKQKHKTKHKSKDRDREKSKRRGDRMNKNDRETSSSSLNSNLGDKQTRTSNQSVTPDDKQILSKLKAVQKRRMCAADFM